MLVAMKPAIILTLMLIVRVDLMSGDYELQVMFHSYRNPNHRVASTNRCCDRGGPCSVENCDSFFTFCQRPTRPIGTKVMSTFNNQTTAQIACGNSSIIQTFPQMDTDNVNFSNTLFGLSNPIALSGRLWPMDGIQLYLEILDEDSRKNDLIDRFAINITVPPDSSVPLTTYYGIFNVAELDMSFRIDCSMDFMGPNCSEQNTVELERTEEGRNSSVTTRRQQMKRNRTTGIIIGSVLMLIVALLILASAVTILCAITARRKKRKRREKVACVIELQSSAGGTCTDTTQISPINDYSEIEDICTSTDGNIAMIDRLLLPSEKLEDRIAEYDYDKPFWSPADDEEELKMQFKELKIQDITQDELKEISVLGSGAFGIVHRGVWSHSGGEEEVAVKSMESGISEEERVKFLQEAAIMGQFNHPNIIRILGIKREEPVKIVTELMSKGDLRMHLLEIKPSPEESVSPELAPTLLSYSRQVACGMTYLAMKSFIHRDIAARNILVSEDGICKIADFGLSRDLQDANYYVSHGGKIPVKWTAPEALHYHKYSTASDVWSYGCALYEIWSLGVKPFHDATNQEAMKKINAGFRLPPPPGCPRTIYEAMIQCWQPKANERLAINDILTPLQKPDFRILNWTSEETKMYSNEARTLGANLDAGNRLHMDLQRTYLILNPSDREVVTNDIGGTGNTSTIEKEEMSTVGLNKDDDSYS